MSSASKRLQEEAARWFIRMQKAAPDHPDRSRFEAWLLASPAHASEYAAFADTWEDFDSTARLESLAHAVERKKSAFSEHILKPALATVALLAVAVVSAVFGYGIWQSQPVYQLARTTGVGEVVQQQLQDGTQLTLNADTQIKIVYSRNQRKAIIQRGEAIFDVSRDPDRPFIVDSGHARVTVLGTHFAVNRLQQLVRVSVDHGRVRVEAQDAAGKPLPPALILTDGEVAEVNAGSDPLRVPRNAGDGFGFLSGSITFQQATMDEIAETLSRYRQTKLRSQVADKSVHVTAVIQTRDVEAFLQALPRVAPVTLQQQADGTQLIVRKPAR